MATSQIDLCNRALRRLGTQSTITSLTDGSVEADTCAAFYDDVLGAMLENPNCSAYPNYSWQWPRRVTSGVGATSTDPRWKYEYALPSDCSNVSGLIDPQAPDGWWQQPERLFMLRVPYEIGAGNAGGTSLVPVIWVNLPTIDVLYVSNGLAIDSWPASFRRAFWLMLAAEMGTTLGVGGATISSIAEEADRAVAQACQADQRVEVTNTSYLPDWMTARFNGDGRCNPEQFDPSIQVEPSGFIVGTLNGSSPIPAYLTVSNTLSGSPVTGLPDDSERMRFGQYISAWTPDSRIGVLTIGVSPAGWRRPYHQSIMLGVNPGDGEVEA